MFHSLRWRAVALAILALLAAGCRKSPQTARPPQADQVRALFFDVGQGDSALLTTANAAVLFDAGPNGASAAWLRRVGIRRLDLLVLSHPHRDHDGGLRAVARAVEIRKIWYSGLDARRWPRELEQLPAEQVRAGDHLSIAGLRLTVLHPDPDVSPSEDVNNNSLVVRAESGGTSYLFPGDCEMGCWEDLFRHHRGQLRSDVLKAAHHGASSGTSSGVLVNVRPRVVVISCGRDNAYGHPHAIVLRLIDKLGAQLFRTDENGTIRCDGAVCASAF